MSVAGNGRPGLELEINRCCAISRSVLFWIGRAVEPKIDAPPTDAPPTRRFSVNRVDMLSLERPGIVFKERWDALETSGEPKIAISRSREVILALSETNVESEA